VARHPAGGADFSYENRFGDDLPMVSDSALKQMICNVLDNALEASPRWLRLEAARDADTLTLTVTDEGPGFAPAMLKRSSASPTSRARAGPARAGAVPGRQRGAHLGGTVAAHNRPEGGAIVTITLPLAAIVLEAEDVEDAKRGDRTTPPPANDE
jgi:two-component system sensor histidine kinase RegB